MTAATKAEAAKAFYGLSRKWAKRFGKVEMSPPEESIVEVDERMHFRLEAGGPATNRAVAKILLSFFLHIGGARSSVLELIEFVRSGDVGPSVDAGWYDGPPVHPAEGEAMLRHVVAVRGSAAEGRLLGYLELFGTLCFAVVLADPYDGPTVSRAHVLNLLDRGAVELDAAEFAGYPWRVAGSASTTALKRGLTEVMRRANQLAAERRFERKWGARIAGAIQRAMEACANGRTEIPMEELWPQLARELQPTIDAFGRDLVDRRRRAAGRAASADDMPPAEPSADDEGDPDGDP